MKQCEKRIRQASTQSSSSGPTIPYSPMNHWIPLVLQCADSMRPFNMVNDKFFQMQVEMLCPGTQLPSHTTIQRDTISLFQLLLLHVQQYFQVHIYFNVCFFLY
ncbi:hypothetical protein BDQ17DRAFT_1259349 [Cyathus striatus]|nr:hypothetical protein BDQ17DRAFT_1259349 [Cyathus striatus]